MKSKFAALTFIIVLSQLFLSGFAFAQTINNPPTLTNLSQNKSDSTTQIPENGITQESTVVFKATLNDQDNDQVKLQVELKEKNQPFDGANIIESSFVASGGEATITRYGLVPQSYKWRARVVDSRGGVSLWQEFGAPNNIDFTVGRTINVAVILAEPSDKSFDPSHNKTYFETQIIPDVKDYYCEVSFGKRGQDGICRDGLVNLNFEVFDNNGAPYKLSQTQQYYGENFSSALDIDVNGDGVVDLKDNDRTEVFAWDAINMADGGVNYNNYLGVIVIYYGDSEQDISLQNYRLLTQAVSFSPTNTLIGSVRNWTTVSENELRFPWFHEIGHTIGNIFIGSPLCDLYKDANPCVLNYGGSVSNRWDIMGERSTGETLFDFISHLSSFSKLKLGWFKEENVGYGVYTIESLETSYLGDTVKRYNLSDGSYYLLEARTNDIQYSKWDVDVPKDALVIYKVSPKQVIINNQLNNIELVNIAKDIGLIGGLPYTDPTNKLLIGPINWTADSNNFKINAEISERNLQNYIGMTLEPKLFLLEKVWEFATTPLRNARADLNEQGLNSHNYLFARVQDVKAALKNQFIEFIENDFSISLVALLFISLIVLIAIKRSKNKERLLNKLKRYDHIIIIFIIFFALIVVLRALDAFGVYPRDIIRIFSPTRAPLDALGPDLDLHAITPDGKHIGMNYETGEYENQIPNAIASGDLVYDDEWIFVPEGTPVKYYTSSHDIQQFLNENPDIAQQLPTTQETYTLSAMYYDSQSQKFESQPLVNQPINPGENIVYQITGTTDIAVTPGITDNQAPTITHTQINVEYLLNSPSLTFNFSADDGNGAGVKEITATLDGQSIVNGATINLNQIRAHIIEITATDFLGNSATQTVNFQVVYQFNGYLPPIKADGSGVYKLGRTLPVKFQLIDANNQYIPTANAQLFVAKISDGIAGNDEIPLSTSNADTGNQFRYDQTENQYIYNLSTDTLSVGSWQLKVVLDDGKYYAVVVSVK